jgi:undecaprenyl-phosphate galactose phosphotransferase
MSVDAEQQLRTLLASDPAVREEWEREFKLRNDPRVTRVGRFLRRTSLDELPQLLNVIRGEMSLVGPRPVIQEELMRYGDDVDYFLMVRPGMTGLWQVSGRNDLDYDTRVYLDTWYVKNWSMWYDIAILFSTVKVVMQGKGSY